LQSGQYPLFVAEGRAEKKRQQIQQSGYLSYCLGKLERIENSLVIYGHSLGDSDQHILDTIADNPKLKTVCVGMFDEPDSPSSTTIRNAANRIVRRRKDWRKARNHFSELEVLYFDSKTALVWSA
jgi:hypothetical protein